MSARPFLVGVLAGAAACGSGETSVRVVALFPPSVAVNQLRFAVEDGQGGEPSPVLRPAVPAGQLPSGSSLVFLLPDSSADELISVEVDGLSGGVEVATGTSSAVPARGQEVDLSVTLAPPPTAAAPDGGLPAVGADAGRDAGAADDGGARGPDGGPASGSGAATASTGSALATGGTGRQTAASSTGGAGTSAATGSGSTTSGGAGSSAGETSGSTSGASGQAESSSSAGASSGGLSGSSTGGGPGGGTSGASGQAASSSTGGSSSSTTGGAVVCGPASCAGCCAAGVCEAGDATSACGVGGVACQACKIHGNHGCLAGACF